MQEKSIPALGSLIAGTNTYAGISIKINMSMKKKENEVK